MKLAFPAKTRAYILSRLQRLMEQVERNPELVPIFMWDAKPEGMTEEAWDAAHFLVEVHPVGLASEDVGRP